MSKLCSYIYQVNQHFPAHQHFLAGQRFLWERIYKMNHNYVFKYRKMYGRVGADKHPLSFYEAYLALQVNPTIEIVLQCY